MVFGLFSCSQGEIIDKSKDRNVSQELTQKNCDFSLENIGSILVNTNLNKFSEDLITRVSNQGIEILEYPNAQKCSCSDGRYLFTLLYDEKLDLLCCDCQMYCDKKIALIIQSELKSLKISKVGKHKSEKYLLSVFINSNLNLVNYTNPKMLIENPGIYN